jgi:hypothetical protein
MMTFADLPATMCMEHQSPTIAEDGTMSAKLRWAALWLFAGLLAGCGSIDSRPASRPTQEAVEEGPIAIGKPAPEISGEDLDGKSFKLSDYRGKVVMLDFWGNW